MSTCKMFDPWPWLRRVRIPNGCHEGHDLVLRTRCVQRLTTHGCAPFGKWYAFEGDRAQCAGCGDVQHAERDDRMYLASWRVKPRGNAEMCAERGFWAPARSRCLPLAWFKIKPEPVPMCEVGGER